MNEGRNQRALLMEILIVVLFFALCSTVLLETFVAAREYSRRAGTESIALVTAQDLAERMNGGNEREAILIEAGYAKEDGVWYLETDDYRTEVELASEETEAGMLLTAQIHVLRDGHTLFVLPAARYVPREVW